MLHYGIRGATAGSAMVVRRDESYDTPLLTREEEVELAQRSLAGDRAALARLISAHRRFVVKIARKYRNYGLPMNDLVQEGTIGFIQAVTRTSSPLVTPPSRPPALFVGRRTHGIVPEGDDPAGTISSCTCDPGRWPTSGPRPMPIGHRPSATHSPGTTPARRRDTPSRHRPANPAASPSRRRRPGPRCAACWRAAPCSR